MRGERRTAYWMAAPALIVVLAIIVYPLAFATYYGFREVRANLVVQLREIGVVGTQLGAIIPHTVFFLPFAVSGYSPRSSASCRRR